jgi:flagellar motility protein MotE (MotC chaperone)
MEPESAAQAMEAWAPQDSAVVLQMIDEEVRGEILNAMKPDKSAAILDAMKDVSAPKGPAAQ